MSDSVLEPHVRPPNRIYPDNNILFLDFDGVLNSDNWIWSHSGPDCRDDDFAHIDPSRVEIVNRIVDEFNCKVVISSAWRVLFNLSDLRSGLRGKGATFWNRIVDKTDQRGPIRGEEIARYSEKYPDNKIVILDDSTDMGRMMPFLVRTDASTGIVEADIDRVRAVLNSQRN